MAVPTCDFSLSMVVIQAVLDKLKIRDTGTLSLGEPVTVMNRDHFDVIDRLEDSYVLKVDFSRHGTIA